MSVAIIGWGAAGLMCATTLLESDYKEDIFLFDKNPHLGAKVIISWGGRCNVTTGFYKKQDLKSKFPHGRDFIQESIAQFGARKIRSRFEEHNVPLKEEKDGRIFPVSNNGKDVVWAFEKLFENHKNIFTKLKERVETITKQWDGFLVTTDLAQYTVDKVVITTWGNAYRHTGSSGDGYAFALELGHTITDLGPSLTSFETEEEHFHELSGISFPDSRIIGKDGKQFDGPLLLTHFGITGPMVFAYSAFAAFEKVSKEEPLSIKWIPDNKMSYDKWMEVLQQGVKQYSQKQLNTFLKQYFPLRFVDLIIDNYGLPPMQVMGKYTKEMFKIVAQTLGNWITLHISWRRNGDEFVTSGWVPTTEINHQTMESLLCPGLYFAGEIMDVDGVTWGYNLTSSRATGRRAGVSIISK